MRKVELDLKEDQNKKMFDLVEKRQKIADRAIEIQEEFKKLGEELKQREHEMNRLQDKSRPTILEYSEQWELGDFEQITGVFIEEGKLFCHISDQVEDFKEMLRVQKKKEENKNEEQKDENTTDK